MRIDLHDVLEPPRTIEPDIALNLLQHGKLTLYGLIPWGSNYTFLGLVEDGSSRMNVIYKPCRGERLLWDFEENSLCRRETATYLVSCAPGNWPAVPPTALRDGPHGLGSVQQFIYADFNVHYFDLKDMPEHRAAFQQLAAFDYLINNADRKAGHCLLDAQNKIWAIDHGLSFHIERKLRTVIWEYANQKIPQDLSQSLQQFRDSFTLAGQLHRNLSKLLSPRELEAFSRRLDNLLASGRFPHPLGARDYPFPPI